MNKSMKSILSALIFLMGCGQVSGQEYHMSSGIRLDPKNPQSVADEVIIRFKDEVDITILASDNGVQTNLVSLNKTLEMVHGKSMRKVFRSCTRKSFEDYNAQQTGNRKVTALYNFYRLKLNDRQDINEVISILKSDPTVNYAEPNYVFYAIDLIPDDPIYQAGAQWHLDTIGGPAAWSITTSDTNQVIGILDTGIDLNHPDLEANIWINRDEVPGNGIDDDNNGFIDDHRGWDFVNDDNFPDDDNSHGTHVSGIVAAVSNNTTGVAGVAWNARLMALKMLQSSGQGNAADFAEAIQYAAENGATVINMSVGSYAESFAVKAALEYAYSSASLVASAGNDFYNLDMAPMYPACYSYVLGVESSDFYNELAFFSNFDIDGPVTSTFPQLYNYEVRAPGLAIYSTFPNGGYHALTGTSMSAPIVSGSVALLKSHFPGISNEKIFVRLIQGAENGVLNIFNSLTISPVPVLQFLDFSILDTLPGCDRDGIADAGETIQMLVNLRNCGGTADSVWSTLRFGLYEDTTVAIIQDSTSLIGDISEYATLNNSLAPFKVHIPSGVAHNRDIIFNVITGAANSETIQTPIMIKVHNAKELAGVMDTVMYLTPEKLWFVKRSFRVGSNGIIHILPGTTLELQKEFINRGRVDGYGTPDSLINIIGPGAFGGLWEFSYTKFTSPESLVGDNSRQEKRYPPGNKLAHCIIIGVEGALGASCYEDCSFINSFGNRWADSVLRCNFDLSSTFHFWAPNYMAFNNFSGSFAFFHEGVADSTHLGPNNIVTTTPQYFFQCPIQRIPSQYYGTTDTAWIDAHIYDFEESLEWCTQAQFTPVLAAPTPLAHGLVWKIHINGFNPQEINMDPIGAEQVRFDVYFNRPMDTLFEPQLSFGVRSPYNQHIVTDSASWNADSTIWTAYFDVSLETGDGMNWLRVQNARDPEGFEIPVENNKRFGFMVQSAGSASIPFLAIPGIGRSTLRWAHASTPDILGYILYRFTTSTDTVRLNAGFLLTDTTHIDFNVIPDTTYHYLYTIIGTDFKESDFSRVVLCTPVPAVAGDANGDGEVNVLDITAVISYMLNQSPLPFLFSAADMNHDNMINVLDIIGIVDIILEKKKMATNVTGTNNNPAYIWIDDDRISFKSDGNVAAMQFELTGQNLEGIRLILKQQGFEFATGIVKGKLTGIIYNLENRTIPEGMVKLAGIECKSSPLSWGEVIAGDPEGRQVEVLRDFREPISNEFQLQAFPNPFKGSVTISYRLAEPATITLSIYNNQGQLIEILENRERRTGVCALDWNGENVSSGVYYCRLNGKTEQGIEVESEVKIVLMK